MVPSPGERSPTVITPLYRSLAFVAAVNLSVILTIGCGGAGTDPSEPNPVASVSLSPASASLEPGRTLRLSPTLRDARRLIVTGRDVAWQSSAPRIAMVTDGLVTGVMEGFAVITASVGGSTGTASITVQRPVSTVEIRPEDPTIAVGGSIQLTASLRGSGGHRVEGPVVSWSSSDPGVAAVGVGKVRGIRVGLALITATAGDKSGVTSVAVLPNISGRWILATAFSDSAGGIFCSATESLAIGQTGAMFGGTLERLGICTRARDTLNISGRLVLMDGIVSAGQLVFGIGGQPPCTYAADLSGTPPAGAAGYVTCAGQLAGELAVLRGTWEMRR